MGKVQKIGVTAEFMTPAVPGPVIVTGATGSMGAAAVRSLASDGVPVIMACRNMEKAESVAESVLRDFPDAQIRRFRLNLESLSSVREFASALEGVPLAGLFNNAGTLLRDYSVTVDGFERVMAVNYLAPYLLTRLLLGNFREGAHIVNMVSLTTKFASLDLNWPERKPSQYSQLGTYGSSKLALLYFTIALSRRCPSLHVNMADPGVVNSNMITMGRWYDPLADVIFRPFIKSPDKGVQPALRALETSHNLKYFVGNGWEEVPGRFLRSPLVEKLWDQAAGLVGLE